MEEPNKFNCEFCAYPFTRKDHMNAHIKKLHNPNPLIRKFVCPLPECSVLSAYKSNWTIHLKNIHGFEEDEIAEMEMESVPVPKGCENKHITS